MSLAAIRGRGRASCFQATNCIFAAVIRSHRTPGRIARKGVAVRAAAFIKRRREHAAQTASIVAFLKER